MLTKASCCCCETARVSLCVWTFPGPERVARVLPLSRYGGRTAPCWRGPVMRARKHKYLFLPTLLLWPRVLSLLCHTRFPLALHCASERKPPRLARLIFASLAVTQHLSMVIFFSVGIDGSRRNTGLLSIPCIQIHSGGYCSCCNQVPWVEC